MQDYLINIIGFIVSIFIAFLTAYFTSRGNEKKTTNEYFKKEGIKVQKRLLEFWTNQLFYDVSKCCEIYKEEANISKKVSNTEVINIIIKEASIYSSKETIKALGSYQQFNYNIHHKKKDNKYYMVKTIITPLRITKRMKYDFTGEKLNILDILKVKLNDYDYKIAILFYIIEIEYFIKEHLFLFSLIIILLLMSTILILSML